MKNNEKATGEDASQDRHGGLSVCARGATRLVIEVVSLDGVSRFNRSLSQS